MSEKILIRNARIIDGSDEPAFRGQVLVAGERIVAVTPQDTPALAMDAAVIDVAGRTLMPGMIEAHAHISFTNMNELMDLVRMPVEEHLLATLKNARLMLDQGFTSLFSAASAKPRLDVVVRNAIAAGEFPGPRLLAATREMTPSGNLGDLEQAHLPIPEQSRFAVVCDGANAFRKACRLAARDGVDTFKVNVSGDRGWARMGAGENATLMAEDELAEVVRIARERGKRVAAHATSAASVKLCVKHGVDVIYHAANVDREACDLLVAARDRVFVAPTIGFPYVLRYEVEPLSEEALRALDAEIAAASGAMAQLRERGVRVLPGGDYGIGKNRIGTNARDLEHFVTLFGFSPQQAIVAATRMGGELMGMGDELGQIRSGFLADLLVVDGDPLSDISLLQDAANLKLIMQSGRVYKNTLPDQI